MEVYEAVKKRRTIRRFAGEPIKIEILKRLVEAARLAPSGGNRQPLEFIVVSDPERVKRVAEHVYWAAYIKPEGNPPPGSGPRAFIATLVNEQIAPDGAPYDVGAAVMSMILAAYAERIGSCWMASIDRESIMKILNVPEKGWKLDNMLALGFPDESPVVENFKGSVKYWKDEKGTLHVPKRALEDILHEESF